METDTWPNASKELRERWQRRRQAENLQDDDWETHEPWYRYGYEMAETGDYRGRGWSQVEDDLRAGYPDWARQRGYTYKDEDSLWDRFKASVRDAWDSVTGKR
jgi:hypothetical protein